LGEVEAGHSVNNLENHFEDLESVFMLAVFRADFDVCSQKHFVFVVDLLIGNMEV
jgi:hypothetical protein